MSSVEGTLIGRITAVVERKGLQREATFKSLRAYSTKAHPLLLERLMALGAIDDEMSDLSCETSSYQTHRVQDGFQGNQLMNYIFASFFELEEPAYQRVIKVSASDKTLAIFDHPTRSVQSQLCSILDDFGCEHQNYIVDFKEVVATLLGQSLVEDLFQVQFLSSTLSLSILKFLREHDNIFPATEHITVPGRIVRSDLVMSEKYYPERDDLRAYCRDHNLARHLSGILLQRLINPREKGIVDNLQRSRVIPRVGKDILNISLPAGLPSEAAVAVLGDISNFTGSLANSWLMLYCMALELSVGGLRGKIANVFSLCGRCIEATWFEIIVVYLYSTVGYPCWAEEYNEYAYLPGGYLGVAANISAGLLFLAVTLEHTKRLLTPGLFHVISQAGGDDFFYGLVGLPSAVEDSVNVIRKQKEDYLGKLKEFQVINLKSVPDGVLEGILFCKKRVIKTTRHNIIHITSEPSIPIVSSITPAGRLYKEDEIRKAWREIDQSLLIYERSAPMNFRICDSLRQTFLSLYPSCAPPVRSGTSFEVPPSLFVECIEGYYVTERAMRKLVKIPEITGRNGITYLTALSDKISLALSVNLLQCREALRGDVLVQVVGVVGDMRMLNRKSQDYLLGLDFDTQLVNTIVDLLV